MNTPFQSIEWTDSMSTGIDAIDQQHHFLVDTLQEANEKLLSEHDNAVLSDITKILLRYAITHFETEEKLMQRYGYAKSHPAEAQQHIKQHREFSRQVVAVCEQLRERRDVSHIELTTFLNSWLRDHLLGIDQLLGEFLRQAIGEAGNEPNT
jgi:hemerythrin